MVITKDVILHYTNKIPAQYDTIIDETTEVITLRKNYNENSLTQSNDDHLFSIGTSTQFVPVRDISE